MRILVIDNNLDVVRLLEIKLSKAGHDVSTAVDGDAASALAKQTRPEVMILETEVSGKSGLDLIREFKKSPEKVPLVLVLSHRTSDEAILAAFEAGADDYVTKPFSPRVLDERIRIAALRDR